jgi:DNA mismatch repair protein MutS
MTPLREQYLQIKKQFPDTIVFFRLGDFYETFDDDAKIVSQVCNIVLTGREMGTGNRVPLAGVPYHAVESYLSKLIQSGHKVAIIEQTSDEVQKGLMTREVSRVVTPGTVIEPALLQDAKNNYLCSFVVEERRAAIAYADITTGEFAATELDASEMRAELDRLQPAELLIDARQSALDHASDPKSYLQSLGLQYPVSAIRFPDLDAARGILCGQFRVASLDGFGLGELPLATRAAGAVVQYLHENQKSALAQLDTVRVYSTHSFMTLDSATRRNLELVAAIRGDTNGSLLGVLDHTRTPMGGRLLRQWITQPLLDRAALEQRLDKVDRFVQDTSRREELRALLRSFGDLERLANRVAQGIASPRDLLGLKHSLDTVPQIQSLIGSFNYPVIDSCNAVRELIGRAIRQDAPATLANGGIIATRFSTELDTIVEAAHNAKDWVASLERTERERTGIRSLKVGYNRVFGYYIEVTTPNLPQVPQSYIRKQTLANAERFITPELKEYETTILNAEDRMVELETSLYKQILSEIAVSMERLISSAHAIAELDLQTALAQVAVTNRYVRPSFGDDNQIEIVAGRHPVVELTLSDSPFVPNDVKLGTNECIHLITGPNMAGKSTYLRQTALIVLMAQIGSFVPAERATIALVDRIFTRIGAHDEISAGQSTFMVEMVETANILHHATSRSLIILDEIGRGTSTYDGIAIARAIIEYIHNHPRLGAKTLFATHYHELTELEDYLPRVRNYNVAVIEQGDQVVFLHKIVPGGADKSYGIHVAELAGIPAPVITRAQQVLIELETDHASRAQSPIQLQMFSPDDQVRNELAQLDPMAMSPLEALNKLFELHKKAIE